MEKEKKYIPENWICVDEIISQVWRESWEQLTPPEKDILKNYIEKEEFQEFKIITLPAGMFCLSSASLENMYYIMSIVFMVIQSLKIYHLKSQHQLTENEIDRMIKNAIEKHSKEEQKRINKLISIKYKELIKALKTKDKKNIEE
jgi:hypothetical protein